MPAAELKDALEHMIAVSDRALAMIAANVADPTSLEPFRTLHATLVEIRATAAELTTQLDSSEKR